MKNPQHIVTITPVIDQIDKDNKFEVTNLSSQSSSFEEDKNKWDTMTVLTVLLLLITGTSNTFILKLQDAQGFSHPIAQSMMILTGQYMNTFTFLIPQLIPNLRQTHLESVKAESIATKKSANVEILFIALSAFFDVLALVVQNFALQMIQPSMYFFFIKKKISNVERGSDCGILYRLKIGIQDSGPQASLTRGYLRCIWIYLWYLIFC